MGKGPAKVSVVIPLYNGRDVIAETIQTVLTQTFKDLEIVVVDGGSSDGTGDLLETLRNKHSCLRVLHRPGKLGLGTAYRHVFHLLLKEPYDRYVSMDADLSHQPDSIPSLLCHGVQDLPETHSMKEPMEEET